MTKFLNSSNKVITTINKIMTIHTMKLATTPFEKIVSGNKITESTLYGEKRRQTSAYPSPYGILCVYGF